MKLAKIVGWVVIGILIGAVGASATRPAKAQTRTEDRLLTSYSGQTIGNYSLFWVKDAKTGACWLGAHGRDSGISLAVAPPAACQ